MTLLVNLWAGPGAGKSTTATGVFSRLKQLGYNCEFVSEYAKDLTWSKDHERLSNQFLVSGEQLRKVAVLMGQVDIIITDSPIMLGTLYNPEPRFAKALQWAYDGMFVKDVDTSIDIILTRVKKFQPIGRNQTEADAKVIDSQIRWMVPYPDGIYDGGSSETIQKIVKQIGVYVGR